MDGHAGWKLNLFQFFPPRVVEQKSLESDCHSFLLQLKKSLDILFLVLWKHIVYKKRCLVLKRENAHKAL